MTERDRVIVIGGGHNGLVCAAYLARAGREVVVLEAAPRVGGATVTREFSPGFKVSAGAHLLYGLDPVVAKDLKLASHGLSFARMGLLTVALARSGSPLVLNGVAVEQGELSAKDRAALVQFDARMRRFAALLARQHRRVPSRLAWQSWREAMSAALLAFDIRMLGRRDMREFLRIATMNIFDVLEECFESAQLKGALALDGVLGTNLGPRSGHTVLSMLHRLSGQRNALDSEGGTGGVGTERGMRDRSRLRSGGEQSSGLLLPRGGMGAVTTAMAAAASAAGAEIRISSPVASLLLDGDRIAGVRLETGEELHASAVVSNADPKTTFLKLLGARHLETEFAQRVDHIRIKGTAAKLHLALSGLPNFARVDPAHVGERLIIADDLDYIDQAFNPAKYREYSERPVLEISIPSVHDTTLAPSGKHVLSAIVQYAPYDLAGGWNARRDKFRDTVLGVLEDHAPGLRDLVIDAELLAPPDLEREFRMTGGHWHHGEITLDQYLMLRPVPGAAQYATPIRNLYLCGAGSHPGGGVMGCAGYNAAKVVLRA
ncbi:MAG: NAD(P)/FAD-dependent oxidoreductase [Gammaproteobacteria bacterium]